MSKTYGMNGNASGKDASTTKPNGLPSSKEKRGNETMSKEVIMRLTSDHIKVKGGEYVRDLVRCSECDVAHICNMAPKLIAEAEGEDGFCSFGEVRDE